MVVIYWLILVLGTAFSAYAEVRVQAEADKSDHYENMSVPITIMITHPTSAAVDEASFVLGEEAIKVDKVQEVGDLSRNVGVISIYRYDLPAKAKGLHMLPALSVKVGGGIYRSVASTFEVKGADSPIDNPPAVAASSSGLFLKLETIIDGPTLLYPGQTTVVGYRYSYNADIETTQEVTPLFDPQGFLKVGDKLVNNRNTAEASILEVTQRIEAKSPGVYQIGPSFVEGYVYTESGGRRAYSKNKLKSVAPVVSLTVKPLPEENMPASFNGAVGKYSFKVSLKGPSSMTVGDEITLLVEIAGQGDWATVQLPELCCQPGMSGVFKLSDLPPVGTVNAQAKTFTLNLRPLSAAVKAIPSLEFSYFDPGAQKFTVLHSSPISISVAELKTPPEEMIEALPEVPSEKGAWRQAIGQAPSMEVVGNYMLTSQDLQNRWFSSWWMLLIVPLGIAFLIYQTNLKRFLSTRQKEAPASISAVLYEEAWQEPPHTPAFYAKLYEAFFARLRERGQIEASVHSIEKLPLEGAAGDVKALLMALEEARYAKDHGIKEGQLLEVAGQLFKELEVSP